MDSLRVLVLGANGMIGSTMVRVLSEKSNWTVFGTVRTSNSKRFFPTGIAEHLIQDVDINNHDTLVRVLRQVRPNVLINCVGLTKHLPEAENPLAAIPINALFPHQLAGLCELSNARLVHISTDCVFSGNKGSYEEDDPTDALDIYGRTKALGEVNSPSITLRTSTIGHELQSAHGLLEWFLSQKKQCKGYTRAVFSGLPTVTFARIVRDIVIPNPNLSGLYHVVGQSITKYDLLRLIAKVYSKSIDIVADDQLMIDRSLNGQRFQNATGYVASEWPELINEMHSYRELSGINYVRQ